MAQSRAAIGLREVRQAWADRLPQDPDELFAELLAFPSLNLSLLAVCAATVGAVTGREGDTPAALLAQAVGGYARLVDAHRRATLNTSRAKTLEAVQVFAPEQVNRLAKLKKAELASEAERLRPGRWLPVMFRGVDVPVAEMPVVSATDAEDAAEIADHEEEHALA